MARCSPKRVVYGWPVVVYGWPLKTIEIQQFAVCGEHRWIFDIQTSESLGIASVRRATPAEIVEVMEIAAPLPAELASPLFVTASARVEQDRSSRWRYCVSAWAPEHKRDVTDGLRLTWKVLVVVVSQCF